MDKFKEGETVRVIDGVWVGKWWTVENARASVGFQFLLDRDTADMLNDGLAAASPCNKYGVNYPPEALVKVGTKSKPPDFPDDSLGRAMRLADALDDAVQRAPYPVMWKTPQTIGRVERIIDQTLDEQAELRELRGMLIGRQPELTRPEIVDVVAKALYGRQTPESMPNPVPVPSLEEEEGPILINRPKKKRKELQVMPMQRPIQYNKEQHRSSLL